MAGITLNEALNNLDEAQAAVSAALKAQSTQISTATGGRRIDRALFKDLVAYRDDCQAVVNRLQRGGVLRTFQAVPL